MRRVARSGKSRGVTRTWGQRLLLTMSTFLVVACLTTASALVYLHQQFQDLQRIAFEPGVLTATTGNSEPKNILLVGIDRAEGLEGDSPVLAGRNLSSLLTDTLIVLRIDPRTEQAALLSIPRDLYVPIAGAGHSRKINSAMSLGGPETLIETIKDALGIPIHHYVQVDFLGFQRMVEAIGGVPIYFEHPARDRNSGLAIYEPGCITLNSQQALAYVRSRAFQVDDGGGWRGDGRNDYGRMERQQHFLQRSLKRAVSRGLRNPVTLNELITVGQRNVELDDLLSPGDILDIGLQFRSFNPDTLELYSLPTAEGRAGAADILRLREDEAQDVLEVFRGTAGTLSFERVRIKVENGSGVTGQAGRVAAELKDLGYTITSTSTAAELGQQRTTIRYSAGSEVAAVFLARFLTVDVEFEIADDLRDADVSLVTGEDFSTVLREPRPEDEFADILESLRSTTAMPPSAPTAPVPTTTASTIDPLVAEAAAAC